MVPDVVVGTWRCIGKLRHLPEAYARLAKPYHGRKGAGTIVDGWKAASVGQLGVLRALLSALPYRQVGTVKLVLR